MDLYLAESQANLTMDLYTVELTQIKLTNKIFLSFVYFTSCSDEISSYAIDATFERQLEEIKHLASVFQGPQNYSAELVIRCHPNLSTIGRHTPAIDFTNKISNIAKTNNRIKFVGPKLQYQPNNC